MFTKPKFKKIFSFDNCKGCSITLKQYSRSSAAVGRLGSCTVTEPKALNSASVHNLSQEILAKLL